MVSSGEEINYFGFVSLLRSFDWEIWLCLGHPNSASKLKCFRNACSFLSLFTKVVGIHLSIFFLVIAASICQKVFFPVIFLIPAARVCQFSWLSFASQYTVGRKEYLFFFCDGSTPLKKKKKKKNRWSSGQKNSKMPKISMNNCVGSYRIWLLYFHLFSVRAFFLWWPYVQRYLKSFIIKTSFLKMYV